MRTDGRFLLCANYTGGSVAVFALAEDGNLLDRTDLVAHHGHGPDPHRQDAAHVHMVVPGPGGLVSAVDLGADEIRGYRLDDGGRLIPGPVSALPPGTGPRQLVRRPGTDLGYVVGELAGTLLTVREVTPGSFTVLHTGPATARHDGQPLPAHLELAGVRLLLSSRGPDCVTSFALEGSVPVALADHPAGANPRQFTVLGPRYYVAAQSAHAVLAFGLDGTELGRYPVGSPTCVAPAPWR